MTLFVLILALAAVLAGGNVWSNASWAPKLALDLAGGTQIVLTPKPTQGGRINEDTVSQAIAIIRQRVDASGVAEAEISSQGGRNIVVSLPGDPAEQEDAIRLVSQSAQMQFRPVLWIGDPQPATAAADGAEGEAESTGGASDEESTEGATSSSSPSASTGSPSASTENRAVPRQAASTATDAPTGDATIDPNNLTGVDPAELGAGDLGDFPLSQMGAPELAGTPSDMAQITPEIQAEFEALDCTAGANLAGGKEGAADKPLVTCGTDGSAKYILGPVEVEGSTIKSATAQMGTNQQGMSTGQWVVALELKGKGIGAQRDMSQRLVGAQAPHNQFGVVLDGLVVVSLTAQAVITNGQSEISGDFTQDEVNQLASQLRFGALPISFEVQSTEQISATLGSEQLRNGILAGIIGMLLVVVFMMWQYRALGLVTVASLLVAAALTYVTIAILSWTQGYRLSLPGVTGLIVSIGVTADSFIVYFERVRDELREGRSLPSAVDNGWKRARQTIIASDIINLIAAVVLYFLAVGGVRGFAFTLGLTTIMDLLIVILFTHPMVALLARMKFFASGHKWSGFDLSRQKRPSAYAGRGRVRGPGERMTIVERRAAAAKARQASGDDDPDDLAASSSGPDLTKES